MTPKPLLSLTCQLEECSARLRGNRQTAWKLLSSSTCRLCIGSIIIRPLPIIPYIATEGRSRGITRARAVVPNHRMLAFSWFSCHIFGTQLFQEDRLFYFQARLLLNPLISLTSLLVVCSTGLLAGFLAIIFPTRLFQENRLH